MIRGPLSGIAGLERCNPPAIVVPSLLVESPYGQRSLRPWDGLVDTGADRSALPADLIRELSLREVNRISIRGYDGSRSLQRVYCCELTVTGLGKVRLNPVATYHSHFLLGRDFLAAFDGLILLLDERRRTWSIRDRSHFWRLMFRIFRL